MPFPAPESPSWSESSFRRRRPLTGRRRRNGRGVYAETATWDFVRSSSTRLSRFAIAGSFSRNQT